MDSGFVQAMGRLRKVDIGQSNIDLLLLNIVMKSEEARKLFERSNVK
jgi:hypothetical protein